MKFWVHKPQLLYPSQNPPLSIATGLSIFSLKIFHSLLFKNFDSYLSNPTEHFLANAYAEVLKLWQHVALAKKNDKTGPCPGKTLVHLHFVGLGRFSLH